jgi:hypothetical protein
MRERMRVGEIVDRTDFAHVFLRHGAKDIAPDPPETVDAVVSHNVISDFRISIAD